MALLNAPLEPADNPSEAFLWSPNLRFILLHCRRVKLALPERITM